MKHLFTAMIILISEATSLYQSCFLLEKELKYTLFKVGEIFKIKNLLSLGRYQYPSVQSFDPLRAIKNIRNNNFHSFSFLLCQRGFRSLGPDSWIHLAPSLQRVMHLNRWRLLCKGSKSHKQVAIWYGTGRQCCVFFCFLGNFYDDR